MGEQLKINVRNTVMVYFNGEEFSFSTSLACDLRHVL